MTTPATPPDETPSPGGLRLLLGRFFQLVQFLVALGLAGGVLAYLLLHPDKGEENEPIARPNDPAEVAAPGLIRVPAESTLPHRYKTAEIKRHSHRSAVMTVTGTVVASMRHGKKGEKKDKDTPDYWQFNSPEMLTAYADWQKAIADIKFYQDMVGKTEKLAEARETAQKKVVARAEKMSGVGAEPRMTLETEQANLLEKRLTSEKELHEARNAVKTSQRTEAALVRQLQQGGLDIGLLEKRNRDIDIVIADVPEHRLGQIKIGEPCEATFFGIPDKPFTGKVHSIAPVLAKERRTLRVLFTVRDPLDQLRPGMFAEIGLGTAPRETLMMPAAGIVHVGREDYALVQDRKDERSWHVAPLKLGETYGEGIEVISGVSEGDRVMSSGAILLKQYIARAAHPRSDVAHARGGAR